MQKHTLIVTFYSSFIFLLQSTFQAIQLSASAEIDTHNSDIFVIGDNTLSVSRTVLCFYSYYPRPCCDAYMLIKKHTTTQNSIL